MVSYLDGLVAPEGVYLPTSSFLLPPAPSYPAPPTISSLQAQNVKDGNSSGGGGVMATSANGTIGSISGAAMMGTLSQSGGAMTNGNGSAMNGTDSQTDFNTANGITEGDNLNTALHHISMQAPSAWSHVPFVPYSKISVAGIRYPPSSGAKKDRQQSSHVGTSEAIESSNNDSDSSLPNTDIAGSNASDAVIPPLLGPVLEATLASQGIDGPASHVTGGQGGLPGMAALQLLSHLSGSAPIPTTASLTAGAINQTANKNSLKPKNNIKQTSSSFVQRLQNHTDYTKLFGHRPDGNTLERFAFISRGRILYWLGETTQGWIKDPLARLTFGTNITAHDINQQTRSPFRVDVAIAFTTGDIVWFEALSSRYSRINKAGCVNDAPITSIKWIPGSEMLLLTCHNDGTCVIFDVTRDDSVTGSWTPIRGVTFERKDGMRADEEEMQEYMLESQQQDGQEDPDVIPRPSIKSWEPTSRILVTRPAIQESATDKKTWSKLNPVAHWRVTRSCSITDVAFSPDHTKLAIVSTDGMLRIINLLTESLDGCFESYYGSLNRVIFSPDAKFLLTAGCDDLISVWTSDGRLLSRCPGHTSFVTGIAFDPWRWKIEDRTYRFASVGEDGKVFLWDFSSAALVRPKVPHSTSYQRRSMQGGGSTVSLLHDQHHHHSQRRNSGLRRASTEIDANSFNIFQSALPRGEVAELQPVASYQIGGTVLQQEQGGQGSLPQSASMSSGATTLSSSGVSNATSNNNSINNFSSMGISNNLAVPQANESGSANDLLVEVRFRQDGLMVMHRSGTMRFLQRPRNRTLSRTYTSDLSSSSAKRGIPIR